MSDLQREIDDCIRAGRSFELQSDHAFATGDVLRGQTLWRYAAHCFERADTLARREAIMHFATH